MADVGMRRVMLHGGRHDGFDDSVRLARRVAEGFGAELHVVYTVEDPLSGGWTAEMTPEFLPKLHEAIGTEARERLARVMPAEEQERLGVKVAIRTSAPAAEELVRYTEEHQIDLAIVESRDGEGRAGSIARALLDHGRCSVLVLRGR